ncbi:MAG: YceI family protein [Saprospiraceae bacterium]|nr:YceI family protein [Saprospiraceae bacterium]
MKNILGLLTMIAFVGLAFTNPVNEITTAKVDTDESSVVWRGYKVTGKHYGNVKIQSGSLDFDGEKLVGGEFVIDMTSITCSDLTGDYNGKLVGHLKSDDFFGVATHPTAAFKITKAIPQGTGNRYKIVGDLTIKDITKEIKFFADVESGSAEAKITVDRSEFNVKYGSGSFFDNLGDKTIYDEFELEVSLVTK